MHFWEYTSLCFVYSCTVVAVPVFHNQEGGLLGYLALKQPGHSSLTNQMNAPLGSTNPTVGGMLGSTVGAIRNMYRRPVTSGRGQQSGSLSALEYGPQNPQPIGVAQNNQSNEDDDDDDGPTFTEVVRQVDEEAKEMDPITGWAHSFVGRVLAPRRTVEECPSYVNRYLGKFGAEARRPPERYPEWYRKLAGDD